MNEPSVIKPTRAKVESLETSFLKKLGKNCQDFIAKKVFGADERSDFGNWKHFAKGLKAYRPDFIETYIKFPEIRFALLQGGSKENDALVSNNIAFNVQ